MDYPVFQQFKGIKLRLTAVHKIACVKGYHQLRYAFCKPYHLLRRCNRAFAVVKILDSGNYTL